MKKVLAFIVAVLLASPAIAQTTGRLDPWSIRPAVSAAAASARQPGTTPTHNSRGQTVLAGAVIGGSIGVMTGWLLWDMARDCGTCGPGPANAMVSTGLVGAGIGAWIGAAVGSPVRRPGIPLGRHVTAAPAVSRSRTGGAVTIAF